ncbi:MBL fold metallo-hydrolase [bacterium]|nr:MBL fold metallo-hydrolase [bacterium]
MKRYFLLIIFILILSIFSDNLKVYFVNVGQGDGTLIITPSGKTIVMDCNSGTGDRILKILNDNGYGNTIDYMIATHYHDDHIGGLDDVINGSGGYTGVDVIYGCYDRGGSSGTGAYTNYKNAVDSTTGGRKTVILGSNIDLGDGVSFTFVTENGNVYNSGGSYFTTDENGLSVSIHLRYKEFDLFIGGDLTSGVEELLGPKLGDIDVYQVDHHGSTTSSAENFITAMKAEVSIISCGDGNSYGHPKQEIIDRLVSHNSYIYQTELGAGGTIPIGKGEVASNTILLSTNGCSYDISYGTSPIKTYPCDVSCDDTPPIFAGIEDVYDTQRGGELAIDFSDGTDADGSYPLTYNIYMSTFSNGENYSNPQVSSDTHPAFISNLLIGTTYFFVVRAEDLYGNEDTNTIEIAGSPGPDALPPEFNGIKTISLTGSSGEIQLFWDNAKDNSLPITYNIYRSTISGNENFSAPIHSTGNLNWTDSGLIDGTTYYYIVRANDNNHFEDNNVNEKFASPNGDTLAPVFGGLKQIFSLENRILLVWDWATDNSSDTITYLIYRSEIQGEENFLNPTFTTKDKIFYDDTLIEGITYYYIVRAKDMSENIDNNTTEKSVSLNSVSPIVKIYPNPITEGMLNIELNFQGILNIYSISGTSVYNANNVIENSGDHIKYSVNSLNSGVYIIILRSSKHTIIKKVAIIN